MPIKEVSQYVEFYLELDMGKDVSLLRFANNEKMALKQRLGRKNLEKEPIKIGIKILEELANEIDEKGEEKVLEKYQKNMRENDKK